MTRKIASGSRASIRCSADQSAARKKRPAGESAGGRVAQPRQVRHPVDGQRGKCLGEQLPAPAEQQRRDRLVRIERIARPVGRLRVEPRQRIDPQRQRLLMKHLIDGIGERAHVRLAHHDPPARPQHASSLGEEAPRRRQVVEDVDHHQGADRGVFERQRLRAHLMIVPGCAHDVGELEIGDERPRETRPRAELDARTERGGRQLGGHLPVPVAVEHPQRGVLVPRAAVLLEPRQRARLKLLGERHRARRT